MIKKDEWVPVDEAKPVISARFKRLTENVYVLLNDGNISIGYYNYWKYQWYSQECEEFGKGVVVAWQSI